MDNCRQTTKASTLYLCGGTPRDKYMSRLNNISDLDITNGDKTIDLVAQEFSNALGKTFNVNKKVMDDGHSSVFIGNLKIDFSSNFIVPNIDQHLKNKIPSPTNMQREIFSRDFTCNALLLSLDLKNIIDITKQGFTDIQNKNIKCCLDPKITLTSNKNRVIRSIYLACKLQFDIDKSIVQYVSQNPEIVKNGTQHTAVSKLNHAFGKDADKASFYLSKMNLWNDVPITEVMRPYYDKQIKSTMVFPK